VPLLSFIARCRRWRRPGCVSVGSAVRCGLPIWHYGCGWGCIPGRCRCVAGIMSTTHRSIVVLGCGPPATAGMYCSPRPRATWWQAVWVARTMMLRTQPDDMGG
jgi:hypothetical protein